jgi:APA family basic amino acid/polyamine antiporter
MVWRQRAHGFFWGSEAFEMASNEPQSKSVEGVGMKKCLGFNDLLLLGIAAVVGAGIFVVTGVTARNVAG